MASILDAFKEKQTEERVYTGKKSKSVLSVVVGLLKHTQKVI